MHWEVGRPPGIEIVSFTASVYTVQVASFSLRHSLTLVLWVAKRFLMGLSWAWENNAWGEQTPDEIMSATLQGAGSPVAHSVSVTGPALSNVLAASAAIAASATAQTGHGRRAAARETEAFTAVGSKGNWERLDEIEGLGAVNDTGRKPTDDATASSAQARGGKGGIIVEGDTSAFVRAPGGPSTAQKPRRIGDVDASAMPSGEAARFPVPQKANIPVKRRGPAVNKASIATRQQ